MNCEYYKYKLNLFNLILDKLVTIDNKDIFSGDILLSAFKTSFNHYYKFKVFNDMILNNLFVSNNKKEEFITIFSNVQNIFFKFKKIYYIYCFNKTPVNEAIKYDLHFNDLSIYKNKNKIQLIESNTISKMKSGSILIDLASSSGGNIEGSKIGEKVNINDCVVYAPRNLPSLIAYDASLLFSKNIYNFISNFITENKIFDIEAKDELLLKTTLVKNGNKTENFYDG